ncbi:MAG: hypothetical protein AAGO57_04040 [Pseudomonadota bacterium]
MGPSPLDAALVDRNVLFARIASELAALHMMALDIQNTAGALADGHAPTAQKVTNLQKIDVLTQMIADLSEVAQRLSRHREEAPLSVGDLMSDVRLGDLAKRLSWGGSASPGADDGDVTLF